MLTLPRLHKRNKQANKPVCNWSALTVTSPHSVFTPHHSVLITPRSQYTATSTHNRYVCFSTMQHLQIMIEMQECSTSATGVLNTDAHNVSCYDGETSLCPAPTHILTRTPPPCIGGEEQAEPQTSACPRYITRQAYDLHLAPTASRAPGRLDYAIMQAASSYW